MAGMNMTVDPSPEMLACLEEFRALVERGERVIARINEFEAKQRRASEAEPLGVAGDL